MSNKLLKTVAYYAAFISLGLINAALGPTLPALARQTSSSLSTISFAFTAHSFGYLLGASQGGRLYDRLPGNALMAIALLVAAGLTALVPLIGSPALLLVVLFVTGLNTGSIDSGGNALLIWVHREGVGPYMQALHFSFGLGALISPIVVGRVIEATGGIRWAYWIVALLVIPSVLAVGLQRSPQRRDPAQHGEHRAVDWRLVALIAALLLFFVGTEASFGGWIYTYATAMGLAGAASAAYLTAAFWGALTVGRLVAIPLSMRMSPRRMLLMDAIGCLASVILILLWPASLAAIWIGTLGMGFFMASVFALAFTVAERNMDVSGAISGWFLVGGSVGSMLVPMLIGQFFERSGPSATMVIILIDLLFGLGIFVALSRYIQAKAASQEA
jgi:MFS transporter, FHS family, Na+ dependent glucose transporter 1